MWFERTIGKEKWIFGTRTSHRDSLPCTKLVLPFTTVHVNLVLTVQYFTILPPKRRITGVSAWEIPGNFHGPRSGTFALTRKRFVPYLVIISNFSNLLYPFSDTNDDVSTYLCYRHSLLRPHLGCVVPQQRVCGLPHDFGGNQTYQTW